jgi:alkaline phosphatase D
MALRRRTLGGLAALGLAALSGGGCAPTAGPVAGATRPPSPDASPAGDAWRPPELAGDTLLTRIAFGTCADQEKPQPIWDAILGWQPQLFVFGGDNVYGDRRQGRYLPDGQLMDNLAAAYAMQAAVPGFDRLRRTVPHLVTWDDHDYGRNDAGGDFRYKHASQRQFVAFWRLAAADPRRGRDGVYDARVFGPAGRRVQIVLLDTRFFRSPLRITDQRGAPGRERYLPDEDPSRTMLGDAQWAWLADRLREPAELRVIVSSVQVLAEGHGWERWGNFPRERERLLRLIADTGASGVVLLSGDRHLAALYRETAGLTYPLVEMTSSGLTEAFAGSREPGPNRLGDVYGEPNFGTLEIDWAAGRVVMSVRNLRGDTVRSTTVALDTLRAPGR